MSQQTFELQIGQLMGQVTAMTAAMNAMSATISKLDERLRIEEKNTTELMVKMSMLAVGCGAAGSLIMTLALKHYHLD